MKYDDSVPESVAINEAVELAKKYGQDSAPSFVNGVLARFSENEEKTTSRKESLEPVKKVNDGKIIVKKSTGKPKRRDRK